MAVAALATASVLAACTTSVDGTATFAGGGTVVGTDTGSVPTPSDATVTTESSEPSPSTGNDANADGKCEAAFSSAQKFLDTWDATVANPTPTQDQRNALATEMDLGAYEVNQTAAGITDPTLQALIKSVADEIHKVSLLVVSGSAANLDTYTALMQQVQSYCGL